jgi:hypothetical protein
MAERRQKSGSILLRIGSNARKGIALELFPAEQWTDQAEADTGLYRVRIDDRWVCVGGRQYTFFTPRGLAELLAQELTTPGTLEALERPAPALRRGDRVRWRGPDDVMEQTRLMSDPVLWLDGQWRVWITFYKYGPMLVCCDELKPLDALGREVQP